MIPGRFRIIAALCLLGSTSALAECLAPGWGLPMKAPAQATLRAALTTNPTKIGVGMPFSLEIRLCGFEGGIEKVAIDATMPAHRHGMNYTPSVVAVGEGHFRAEGMLFHMPGRWEVVVTVLDGKAPKRLTLDMDIR